MSDKELTAEEFTRLANNFYNANGLVSDIQRIGVDSHFINYYIQHREDLNKTFKVALCFICVNPLYWQFLKPVVDSAKQFFLPGHKTDFFIWSDIPINEDPETFKKAEEGVIAATLPVNNPVNHEGIIAEIKGAFLNLQENVKGLGATIFPIEPIGWPMPTLMRYHTMLQQEEKLREYDYVFYMDVDMRFLNVVGDEILGERLTAVQQPMYAVRKEFWPPYEPNEKSTSFIKRPGRVVNDNGKPRFMPLYMAGGWQGGRASAWIKAMKEMKKKIDKDLNMNYIPVWNDETVWNSYLFENPDDRDVVLTPSYCYPDSLIEEYFKPMWGQDYQPKLVTLTKKFSFQPGSGEALQKTLSETRKLAV